MAGKGEGAGEGGIMKLENQITILKYTLLFSNVILWMIGASVFALCLWMRFEPSLADWIEKLDLYAFYAGIYILIVAGVVVMIVAFLGCASALQESQLALLIYIGTQVVSFILGSAGSAILLDNSTQDSHIQPVIRESMRRLIMNSHHEPSLAKLSMLQENVGCCGADGPSDYLDLRQPLPSQCRDTVTGNPFYHGCVDELTWYLEEKSGWLAGLVMTICFLHVSNAVMSIVLMKALKKEEREGDFRR